MALVLFIPSLIKKLFNYQRTKIQENCKDNKKEQ